MGRTLSEAESKQLLSSFGVPFVDERVVSDAAGAVRAARELGAPVAVKLNGPGIAHKTERGLVRLGVADLEAVSTAAEELLAAARPEDGPVELLVAPMVGGVRELIVGLHRDAQFGMTAMVGVGGVLTEAIDDVAVGLVPLSRADAGDMVAALRTQQLFGPFRGEDPLDRESLIDLLMALSDAAAVRPDLCAVDLNPVKIDPCGRLVAVDALVEVDE